MNIPDFEALGEKPTVYFAPYDVSDEEGLIFTISNAYYDGYGGIYGNRKDSEKEEYFDLGDIYSTIEEAVNSFPDKEMPITLDGEIIRNYKERKE